MLMLAINIGWTESCRFFCLFIGNLKVKCSVSILLSEAKENRTETQNKVLAHKRESIKWLMLTLSIILYLFFPEVVEHACSVTSLQMGETVSQITKDMDTYSYRVPIGVCAGITPYVFLFVCFFLVDCAC